MKIPPPRGPEERDLERFAKKAAEGDAARDRMVAMAILLNDEGMSQVEIAARASRGAARGNGEPISRNALQKLLARQRKAVA